MKCFCRHCKKNLEMADNKHRKCDRFAHESKSRYHDGHKESRKRRSSSSDRSSHNSKHDKNYNEKDHRKHKLNHHEPDHEEDKNHRKYTREKHTEDKDYRKRKSSPHKESRDGVKDSKSEYSRKREHDTKKDIKIEVDIKEERESPEKYDNRSRNSDPSHRNNSFSNRKRDERDKTKDRRRNNTREWDKIKSESTDIDNFSFGAESQENNSEFEKKDEETKKEEPNFGLSGKLTEYTNTYNGVVIKYNEPPESRKPKTKWRLYPFKGDKALPLLKLHRQSAFLLGRDRKIADIPIDHPSCSTQHAVLQFRLVQYKRPDGEPGKKVKPYVIDLESTNGTFVNNNKIEPRRYVELLEKDVIKFGFSSREYVILHEKSKDDPDDGDDGADSDTNNAQDNDKE